MENQNDGQSMISRHSKSEALDESSFKSKSRVSQSNNLEALFEAASSVKGMPVKTISSVVDLLNNIEQQHLIEMNKMENKIKSAYEEEFHQLKQENKKLKKQLQIVEEQCRTNAKKKINDIKKENSQLVQQYADTKSQLDIVEQQKIVLQHETKDLRNQLSRLNLELSQTKSTFLDTSSNKYDAESLNQTLSLFETLLTEQTKDITQLTNERNQLLSIVQTYGKCSEESDKLIHDAVAKTKEYEMKFHEIEQKSNQMVSNSNNKQQNLLDRVFEKLPETFSFDEFEGEPYDDKIVSIVSRLVQDNIEISQQVDEGASKREIALIGYLENMLKFLRSIADSRPIYGTHDMRTLILTQCARIGKFIDENAVHDSVPQIASLFKSDDPQAQINLFYDFIDENDVDSTPVREVYALFATVILINKMVLDQIEVYRSVPQTTIQENDSFNREFYLLKNKIANSSQKIAECFEDPPEEYFEQVDLLFDHFQRLIQENQQLKDDFDKVTIDAEQLQTKIQEYKEKMTKCADVKKENQNLKNQIESIKQEKEMMINQMKAQIDEALKCITQADSDQLNTEKYKSLYEKKQQRVQELKSELNQIIAERDQVQEENRSLQQQIENEKNSYLTSINEQKQKNKKLGKQIYRLSIKIDEIQEMSLNKAEEYKQKEATIIADYEQRIVSLKQELADEQALRDSAENEINSLQNEKKEYQTQLMKLRMSEKGMNMKLTQLNEQIKMKECSLEAQMKAKSIALRVQAEKSIQEQKEINNHQFERLQAIFSKAFGLVFDGLEFNAVLDRIEVFFNEQNFSINKRTRDEIKKCRDIMSLKEGESISAGASNIVLKLHECEETIHKINKENVQLRSDLKKRPQQNVEWDNWAKTMYKQISDAKIVPFNMSDIRFSLEESLLASIGHRTLRRRLEILRAEKKILLSLSPSPELIQQSKGKIVSLRPLLMIALVSRRLQTLGGCVPSSFRITSFKKSPILFEE